MEHWLVKSLIAVAVGSAAYFGACSVVLPWAPALLSGKVDYFSLQVANTAILFLISGPFAYLLSSPFLKLRSPVVLAAAIALLGLVLPTLPSIGPILRQGIGAASAALDLAKFASMLPLLTWLAVNWLPSNNSSKPTPLRGAA